MSTYGGHIVLIITRDRLDIPANISHMICFFRAPKIPHFSPCTSSSHTEGYIFPKSICIPEIYWYLPKYSWTNNNNSIPEVFQIRYFYWQFKWILHFIACVLPHHPHNNFRCLWTKRGDGDMLRSCASHFGWSCVCSICSESHKCDTFFVTAVSSELWIHIPTAVMQQCHQALHASILTMD